jgi:hypothetical protein
VAALSKELSDEELLAMLGEDEIVVSAPTVEVKGASGAVFTVANQMEADWFMENKQRYLEQYRFGNVADMQDLDRLLGLELLSYRYASWMLQGGVDYDGQFIDDKAIRDHKQKIDQEIRLVKASMGMDRKGRVESEQQSTAEYLKNLLRRAQEFGIHRDHQIAKSIDLMNEVSKLVGLHDRSDEEEKHHLGVSAEQILAWLRDVALPEYRAIDDAFRANQRLWIQDVSHVAS